jgi:hypothetical protein
MHQSGLVAIDRSLVNADCIAFSAAVSVLGFKETVSPILNR